MCCGPNAPRAQSRVWRDGSPETRPSSIETTVDDLDCRRSVQGSGRQDTVTIVHSRPTASHDWCAAKHHPPRIDAETNLGHHAANRPLALWKVVYVSSVLLCGVVPATLSRSGAPPRRDESGGRRGSPRFHSWHQHFCPLLKPSCSSTQCSSSPSLVHVKLSPLLSAFDCCLDVAIERSEFY